MEEEEDEAEGVDAVVDAAPTSPRRVSTARASMDCTRVATLSNCALFFFSCLFYVGESAMPTLNQADFDATLARDFCVCKR